MAIIKLRPATAAIDTRQRFYRDGTELDKGMILTTEFMERHETDYQKLIQTFTAYPDIYLDLLRPTDSNFHLFPYQRLFLRACMRYRHIYITAARATSKTFLSLLSKFLQCIFVPGHKCFIAAPNKGQAAKIARQKVEEFLRIWPLLGNELEIYNGEPHINAGKDYFEVFFKNGSHLSIIGGLDSDRGLRMQSGLIDEVRDIDGQAVAEIILPIVNVSRRTALGDVNEYEKINQQVIYATSAGAKSSYAYEQLIDLFEKAIIDPHDNFVMGLDYRVPAAHGLIDAAHVRDLKMSTAYDEQTFAAEFMGTWVGGSEDSWYNFERLSKYRKIKNPEWHQKYRDDPNVFYFISIDVGRLHDKTVATVFRVNMREEKFYSTVVNIIILGRDAKTKTFTQQAIEVKQLIADYNPREVLIDCNGLGLGLSDELIKTHYATDGTFLPSYGFFNNDDYKKIQPKDSIPILYSMKANGPLKSKINSNAYSRLNGGMVRFLITEQEARAQLLATKVGQKMTMEERVKRIMPHEMTTKLFEELANLRCKQTGLDIQLEQINTRFPDDRYYSLAYGLWRIKELEDEHYKKVKKRSGSTRKLVFFTGGQ